MSHLFFYFFIFLSSCTPFLEGQNSDLDRLNANNDHGFWLENNFQKSFSDWLIKLHLEERWGIQSRKLWYEEYELFLQYDITKWLGKRTPSFLKKITFGPCYNLTKQIEKDTQEVFRTVWVNKPFVETNINCVFWDWKVNQRARFEHLHYCKPHYNDHNTVRYRLAVYTPWKWTYWKFNPYLSNEWFFRKNTVSLENPTGLVGGWFQNRFRVGVAFDLFEKVSTALYWQWRIDKKKPEIRPRWFNVYAIGLATTFDF